MTALAVTNTFAAATVASASQVNTNFTDIVNYINGRNSGSSTWDAVYVASSSAVPLVVNNSTGTVDIANFQDNGTNVLTIANGGVLTQDGGAVFNEAGAIANFRIEGDTEQNLFKIDAGSDRIGIGQATPSHRIHLQGNSGDVNAEMRITTNAVASGYFGCTSGGLNIGTDTAGLIFKVGVTAGGSIQGTGTATLSISSDGNYGFGTTDYGSGTKVIGIVNTTGAPGGTPSGGGVLYVQSGALKYKGSSGTVTTLANA